MITIIDNGDVNLVKKLPDRSSELFIFIPKEYTPDTIAKALTIIQQKVTNTGEIIIAETLPAAFERL